MSQFRSESGVSIPRGLYRWLRSFAKVREAAP
jgi:hypothetical protein